MNRRLLILNGPGLGDLAGYQGRGYRDLSLDDVRADCQAACDEMGFELDFRQTDDQDEMFRWIARDSEAFDGVIINPVGHSPEMINTFEKYRSAIQIIADLEKPVVEVHLTNIYRDLRDIKKPLHEPEGDMGFVCGLGARGYVLAARAIAAKLDGRSSD